MTMVKLSDTLKNTLNTNHCLTCLLKDQFHEMYDMIEKGRGTARNGI